MLSKKRSAAHVIFEDSLPQLPEPKNPPQNATGTESFWLNVIYFELNSDPKILFIFFKVH